MDAKESAADAAYIVADRNRRNAYVDAAYAYRAANVVRQHAERAADAAYNKEMEPYTNERKTS